MAPVEPLRVLPVQLPHTAGQVAVHRFKQQKVVVVHLTKRMHYPVEALAFIAQNVELIAAVVVIQGDVFAPVTARSDVIDGTGELEAEGASHLGNLHPPVGKCWNVGPDPIFRPHLSVTPSFCNRA